MSYHENEWGQWLMEVAARMPLDNKLIQSEKGQQLLKVMLEEEKRAFNWRRGDSETFWIDLQMFTYYGMGDDSVRFICRTQMGLNNHDKYANERNAYAEMIRWLEKLKKINFPDIFTPEKSKTEQERLFHDEMMKSVTEKIEVKLYGNTLRWDKSEYGYEVKEYGQ